MSKLTPVFVTCFLCAAALSAGSLKATRPFAPTAHYALQKIEGWPVRVNKTLLAGKHKQTGTRVIALLRNKLAEMRKILPAKAIKRLQKVTIWVGVNDYAIPNATYHPSKEWLKENGWNPDKAQSIEISNAGIFMHWIRDQPMLLLHELTHAYHDQVLGYNNAEIEHCYNKTRKSGKYNRVKNVSGAVMQAYALNDAQEFFAEATEAYFGKNDYQPFTRSELKYFDPETYRVVEKMWRE